MSELLSKGMIFYISAVALLTLIIAALLHRRLSALEGMRRKRFARSKPADSAAWQINKSVDKSQIRQDRIESVEKRFTLTRRSLYMVLFITALFIAAIPLMSRVSTALLSVSIACISVVIGIAARPLIENFICGLVLCFGKLARIGDTVLVDNEYGTIEDVTLTHCIIRRWDYLRYVVPNTSMMTKEFVNYSLRDHYRWVHVEFWLDYDADLEIVEHIAKSSPCGSRYFSDSEEPRFWIVEMTPESIKCLAVAWATSAADGWMLSVDMRRNLLDAFKAHGIQTHLRHIRLNEHKTNTNDNIHGDPHGSH